MPQPLDVAIVGAQKCGTTALAEFLGTHPGIAVPSTKELHAFDRDGHDWADPDLRHLIGQHFTGGGAGGDCDEHVADGRLRLDATPITLYWPRAVERMVALCPDIRAIVLLRDPVQRAWSHWRMEVARDREDLPFDQAVREGRERVRAAPDGHHRVHSYVERGFYAAQLHRLTEHVPRDRVLLLRQVDLWDHHDATLRRVHDFLGLPPQHPLPRARVVHSYADEDLDAPQPQDVAYLRELFAEDLHRLADEYGVDLRSTPVAP